MKKNTILALVFSALSLTANAAPRTPEQAVEEARAYALEMPAFRQAKITHLSLSDFHSAPMQRVRGAVLATPAYYIVNVGEEDGFVVVSGDDRFKTILGYATQGHVEQGDVLPDGLQYWLNFLSSEMDAALEAGYEGPATSDIRKAPADEQYLQSVEPLITTQWNQKTPFNKLIPNFATGCVATGTAQIMNYWKYPVTGTGSHTNAYFSDKSADFGTTTYDWANMKDVYGGKFDSPAEINAVATLMYHLGVATDMRWTADNSGTPNMYAAYALIHFFNYNKNLHSATRDHLSLGAWKALILQQLYTGHPLCYSGMSSETSAGHFFVLDGFDATSGKFHFNWGWGGAFDGYYEITSLEPGGQGQAGAGAGSYNYDQQILVDVQPTETGEYVACFDAVDVIPVSMKQRKSDVVIRTSKLQNNALDFTGTIGLAVYSTDGSLVTYVPSAEKFPGNLMLGSGYADFFDVHVEMNDVKDGTYTACLAVQHKDHMDTPYPVRAFYGKTTYYTMNVSGNDVTFTSQVLDINLADSEAPVILGPASEGNALYQNVVSTFKVKLKNNGSSTFCDEVGVCIQKGSRDSKRQYITVPCTLMPGEEKEVTVLGRVLREPGDYNLIPCYGDNGTYVVLSNALPVTVGEEIDALRPTEMVSPNQPVYNMQGVRMPQGATLPKGLYIIGGKKVVK